MTPLLYEYGGGVFHKIAWIFYIMDVKRSTGFYPDSKNSPLFGEWAALTSPVKLLVSLMMNALAYEYNIDKDPKAFKLCPWEIPTCHYFRAVNITISAAAQWLELGEARAAAKHRDRAVEFLKYFFHQDPDTKPGSKYQFSDPENGPYPDDDHLNILVIDKKHLYYCKNKLGKWMKDIGQIGPACMGDMLMDKMADPLFIRPKNTETWAPKDFNRLDFPVIGELEGDKKKLSYTARLVLGFIQCHINTAKDKPFAYSNEYITGRLGIKSTALRNAISELRTARYKDAQGVLRAPIEIDLHIDRSNNKRLRRTIKTCCAVKTVKPIVELTAEDFKAQAAENQGANNADLQKADLQKADLQNETSKTDGPVIHIETILLHGRELITLEQAGILIGAAMPSDGIVLKRRKAAARLREFQNRPPFVGYQSGSEPAMRVTGYQVFERWAKNLGLIAGTIQRQSKEAPGGAHLIYEGYNEL